MVDFDDLSRRAFAPSGTRADKDALWGSAFELAEWLFIARGTFPDVRPYIAANASVAAGAPMLKAFTDGDKLARFARANGLATESGSVEMLAIPVATIVPWLEPFGGMGVHGIHFNADDASDGFFAPIAQLALIKQHLAGLAPKAAPIATSPAGLDAGAAMSLGMCFANNPNNVSDVIVTFVDGTVSSGWYSSRFQLGEGAPRITLSHRPDRPGPRPDMVLDLATVAHVKVQLSDGRDQEFGHARPPDAEAEFRRLTRRTGELHAAGDLPKALASAKECCDVVRAGLGDAHRLMSASLANYGELLRLSGRLAEAEDPLARAAEGARRHYPASDPDRARAIVSLATYYFDLGNYEKALPLYRESLELRRAIAPASADVAESLNSLGLVELRRGNLAAAEPLLREAIDMYRAGDAERTRGGARAIHNLAMLYGQAGNLAAAGPLFTRALELRRAMYGDAHPETVESIASLGTYHFVQGQLVEAEAHYRSALAITRAALGEGHPTTAQRCMDLALCYKHMQTQASAAAAEPLLRQAYEVRRATLGEGHPSTIASGQEWSGLRRALGMP